MASVTITKREPNKYLRACIVFIKKSFLDRESFSEGVLYVYQQLKSASDKRAYPKKCIGNPHARLKDVRKMLIFLKC